MLTLFKERHSETNTFLFIFGAVAASVSIVSEFILFTENASGTDFYIKGAAALVFVGCQFVFAYELGAIDLKQQWVRGLLLLITIIPLLYISVSGTASFFESRFSVTKQKSAEQSPEYIRLTKLIAEYEAERAADLELYNDELDKENTWQAGQIQKRRAKTLQLIKETGDQRAALPTPAKTSEEALAASHGDYKNFTWWVYASLTDWCALLCFGLAGLSAKALKAEVKKKQSDQPKKSTIRKQQEAPKVNPKASLLFDQVCNEIKAGNYGDSVISIRKIEEKHNLTSRAQVVELRDNLISAKIIERNPENEKQFRKVTV